MQHKRYLVSGKVQGVSYRRFAEREATALGLFGLARNLRDGRVEIVASGSLERLVAFESRLAQGPTLSRVEGIEKEDVPSGWIQARLSQKAFTVESDGEAPWVLKT